MSRSIEPSCQTLPCPRTQVQPVICSSKLQKDINFMWRQPYAILCRVHIWLSQSKFLHYTTDIMNKKSDIFLIAKKKSDINSGHFLSLSERNSYSTEIFLTTSRAEDSGYEQICDNPTARFDDLKRAAGINTRSPWPTAWQSEARSRYSEVTQILSLDTNRPIRIWSIWSEMDTALLIRSDFLK